MPYLSANIPLLVGANQKEEKKGRRRTCSVLTDQTMFQKSLSSLIRI